VTLSDSGADVRVRTRMHPDPGDRDPGGGCDTGSARARAIPPDDHVRQGSELAIIDHSESPRRPRSQHLAEAAVALTESFLATTAPPTVREGFARIGGDPGEKPVAGPAKALLWLCGLLRALLLLSLWAVAVAVCGTRRRTGGAVVVATVLVSVGIITRALRP
jgi:hypothetical protein